MDTHRWNRVETLFWAALEQSPGDRAVFLDEACAGDAALRAEIEAMLGAEMDQRALVLEERVLRAEDEEEPAATWIGQTVGAYRLAELVGQGGMGAVYRAERADGQFAQQVALKLIRPGFHTSEVTRRFRAERQILASLQHPNIARLLGGGLTEDGRPYLVMEYVEGVPVTEYCDEHRLSIDARLELFEAVCAAVQYAHRSLVVHRDLKPSNILVTRGEDDRPTIKLLDFGIAKLLDPDAAVTLYETQTYARVMTPAYAAPEQVTGAAVTTAADIYALGVLLYELLTGHRPYDVGDRLRAEVERIILEESPLPPSNAVVQPRPPAQTKALATARSTRADRLRRQLAGDLDNIVLMALRKEPERRYGSASELADDVERHRQGLPVRARPDTVAYRVGKFVRRHRTGVAVAAVSALFLVSFSVVTLQQSRIVRAERDKSEQVSYVLLEWMQAANAENYPTLDKEGADGFIAYGKSLVEELDGQPVLQAQVLTTLGTIYWSRQQYADALPPLERALALQRTLHGTGAPLLEGEPVHIHVSETLNRLGAVQRGLERYDEAVATHRVALAMRRALYGDKHPLVAQSLMNKGYALQLGGHLEKAESDLREALAMILAFPEGGKPPRHWQLGNAHAHLGWILQRQGRYAEAETHHEEALSLRKHYIGDHPRTAATYQTLSALAQRRGDYRLAEQYTREALGILQRIHSPEHASVREMSARLRLLRTHRVGNAGVVPTVQLSAQ